MSRFWDVIRSTFWVLPAMFVVGSIGAAAGLVVLDHHLEHVHAFIFYPGPPSGARSLLSSIVTSMITVTGTVFSVSVVVLQLTNTQFSSRAIPMYLRDLTVQATLGLFMATFVYAMVVQRSVAGDGSHGFVPRIAVTTAFAFVLASVGLFIRYVSHISNLVRVATIVDKLADESRHLLQKRYPPDLSPPRPMGALPPQVVVVHAPRAGVVVSVNVTRLRQIASQIDGVAEILVRVGDFRPAGAPLCAVRAARWDECPEDLKRTIPERVKRAVAQDTERTMEMDLAFGFRQMVDIAEKALSPAMNDPTTASQCLDSMHDLLRRLAGRHLPDGRLFDGDGSLRALIPQYGFEDFLELALSEVWQFGREGPQIRSRMRQMVDDLQSIALPGYRPALRRWQSILGEPAGWTAEER